LDSIFIFSICFQSPSGRGQIKKFDTSYFYYTLCNPEVLMDYQNFHANRKFCLCGFVALYTVGSQSYIYG
jgi:hypothetical protein